MSALTKLLPLFTLAATVATPALADRPNLGILIPPVSTSCTAAPVRPSASLPRAIPFADWTSDRPLYTCATTSALTVIRQSLDGVGLVAYGVDVGNHTVLFQITLSSAELAQFQSLVDLNANRVAAQDAVFDQAFTHNVSSNIGKPPPSPPPGPNGTPETDVLAAQLVLLGTVFNEAQAFILGG